MHKNKQGNRTVLGANQPAAVKEEGHCPALSCTVLYSYTNTVTLRLSYLYIISMPHRKNNRWTDILNCTNRNGDDDKLCIQYLKVPYLLSKVE